MATIMEDELDITQTNVTSVKHLNISSPEKLSEMQASQVKSIKPGVDVTSIKGDKPVS